jgi:pimeloyl-ACP methyl ester carboxylesterase
VTVLTNPPAELFALAEARSTRADVSDTAVWTLSGHGQRVLFVHGFRGDHHGLQAVAGALADLTVVSPDLPGFGKSAELESHNLSSYSEWLIDFYTSTGPFDLVVGHSFGTLVVANAIANGLPAGKVCLINPITTRGSTSKSIGNKLAEIYYRIGKNRILGSWLMSSGLVTRSMSIGLTKTKNRWTRSFIHEQHSRYFSSYKSTRVAIEGFQAANSGSVFDYADSLTGPILLIAGSSDAVAPISEQRRLNEVLPDSELVVLEKVGHLSHYEKPVEIAIAITKFLGTE